MYSDIVTLSPLVSLQQTEAGCRGSICAATRRSKLRFGSSTMF